MSIELKLEDDGQIRVSVDRPGERAVSDLIGPMQLIHKICETADLDTEVIGNELMIGLPAESEPDAEG